MGLRELQSNFSYACAEVQDYIKKMHDVSEEIRSDETVEKACDIVRRALGKEPVKPKSEDELPEQPNPEYFNQYESMVENFGFSYEELMHFHNAQGEAVPQFLTKKYNNLVKAMAYENAYHQMAVYGDILKKKMRNPVGTLLADEPRAAND